jgi:hypothetical protein
VACFFAVETVQKCVSGGIFSGVRGQYVEFGCGGERKEKLFAVVVAKVANNS